MKHLWIPKRYWQFVPNWNAIGLVSLFGVSIYLPSLYSMWTTHRPSSPRRSPSRSRCEPPPPPALAVLNIRVTDLRISYLQGIWVRLQLRLEEEESAQLRHVHVRRRCKLRRSRNMIYALQYGVRASRLTSPFLGRDAGRRRTRWCDASPPCRREG